MKQINHSFRWVVYEKEIKPTWSWNFYDKDIAVQTYRTEPTLQVKDIDGTWVDVPTEIIKLTDKNAIL